MLLRTLALLCLSLSLTVPVQAQTSPITDYLVKYYAPGAVAPLQMNDTFPASSVQCNQAAPGATTSTVNPTRIAWDDPNAAGRVCIYTPSGGAALLSFLVGAYEGTLTAINSVGASVESARAPFSRASAPAVPAGLRFTR